LDFQALHNDIGFWCKERCLCSQRRKFRWASRKSGWRSVWDQRSRRRVQWFGDNSRRIRFRSLIKFIGCYCQPDH